MPLVIPKLQAPSPNPRPSALASRQNWRPSARVRLGPAGRPRGTVLIVVIGVMIVLTGLVLVFARQMSVEARAAGNQLASVQADALVEGAAQYVINCLVNNQDRSQLDAEVQAEAVPLGDGYFWLLRPNPDDEKQYAFGLADEASKLNINAVDGDTLLMLPNMTPELAASIVDWREPEGASPEAGGAESDYYLLQPEPYYCKYAPFETLDELLLVKGATPDLLYGVDANRNGVLDTQEANQPGVAVDYSGQWQCGLCKYLTVFSMEPNPTPGPAALPLVGRINIATAPREVLRCLADLTDSDIDLLIARRTASGTDLSDLAWLTGVIPAATLTRLALRITVTSYQYSADIVAVSGNGLGFRRARYVFDLRSGTPRVIFRQDLTHLGWPLSAELREQLRSGRFVPGAAAQVQSQKPALSLGKP